jgi:hypothetical protein
MTGILPDLPEKLRDAIDPLIDLLHARREAQPHMRLETAVIAGHHGNMRLFQQRRRKTHGVGDLHASRFSADVRANVGEAVERALRFTQVTFGSALNRACM